MDPKKKRHVDAGLVASPNSSYVIAAVQAILHASPMLNFLAEDNVHHAQCWSLLQCLSCILCRVFKAMSDNGVGDPSSLVTIWRGTSSRMTEEKSDPLHVLTVFIDLLRMEHVRRNPKYSFIDLVSHPLSAMWFCSVRKEASCPLCGVFNRFDHMSMILLTERVSDLQSSINDEILGSKADECPQCLKRSAQLSTLTVALAPFSSPSGEARYQFYLALSSCCSRSEI